MKAISIRQPWPWFILCGFEWAKDVENRDWKHKCHERGNRLIHASKRMTVKEFDQACEFALLAGATMLPKFDELKRGGIVGMFNITGHVRLSASPWFVGPTALTFTDAYPMPFHPCAGQLGFFEVDDYHLRAAIRHTVSQQEMIV